MEDFDWVSARHECSVLVVFEQLKGSIERDVARRLELRSSREQFNLRISANGDSLTVILEGPKLDQRIRFKIAGAAIVVEKNDQPIFEGAVTLCDDGSCRLKVEEKELELWQFRKRALEQLFFRF